MLLLLLVFVLVNPSPDPTGEAPTTEAPADALGGTEWCGGGGW